MKRLRIALGAVFLAMTLFCGWTAVQAASIDRTVLTISQDWVQKGETVDVTFSLEGFSDIEDGLNALEGTLTYDETVFQEVRAEDFIPADGWETLAYNPENGKLVVIHKAGDRDGGEVFTLKLKAAAQLTPQNTDIRFADVSLSEGREDLEQAGASVPVQVISDEVPDGGPELSPTPQPPTGDTPADGVQGSDDADQNGGTAPQHPPAADTGAPQNGGTSQTQGGGQNSAASQQNQTPAPQPTVTPQATAAGQVTVPAAPAVSQGAGGSTVSNPGSAAATATPNPTATPTPLPQQTAQPQQTAAPAAEQATEETPEQAETQVAKTDKTVFVVLGILFLLCLLVVLLALRKGWLDKKFGRVLAALFVVALAAVLFGGMAYGLQRKGDLNEDGQVDYTDVSMLGRHLVGLTLLDEGQRQAADMNSDGKLTITDLALLIRAVEKTVHYEVTLSSAVESRYLEKEQDFLLPFQAQVSYDAVITAATINGQTYPVQRSEDQSGYAVTLNSGAQAGARTFRFTEVTLAGGQTVPVDFTENFEVLKDIPSLQSFTVEELTDMVQLKARFLVQDPDNAFTDGSLEVIRTTEDSFEATGEQPVTAGWNEMTLDLPEGQTGQLMICVSYDRTSGTLEEDGTAYTGSFTFQKELLFRYDYAFTFSELKALDEGLRETTVFGKNQPIVLQFRSENRSTFAPAWVTVNGGEYAVQWDEETGLCRVTLPGFAESGTQTLQVERVVLSNGRVFPLDEDQTVTVHVEKALPSVENLAAQEVAAGSSLQVSFTVSDPDGALANRKVTVRDADGNLLLEQPFTEDAFDAALTFPKVLTGAYTVEVTADCDVSVDGTAPQPGKLLAQQTLPAQIRVELYDFQADKTYYEKGEWAILSCRLATNAASAVEKLVVNNLALDAQPDEGDLYRVSLPVQDNAGEQTLSLSRVILEDQTVLNATAESRIEVLRALPTVENYEAWDDYDEDQVHFAFDVQDPDGALVSAKAVLTADDGSEPAAEQVLTAAGPQQLTFPVVEGKPYTFTVTLTSRRSVDGSQTAEETVLTRPIQMIREYGLTVSEFSAAKADGTPSLYFEKDEPVQLSFTSHNNTRFVPQALVSGATEYPLTDAGNGQYTLLLDGGSQAGVVDFSADGMRMDNGKLLPIENGRSLRYEILKNTPSVENLTTRKTDQDELQVQFTLTDADGALQGARVRITDEQGALLLEDAVTAGPNEKTVKLTAGERYTVTVLASYDRDTNALGDDANAYTDAELFRQEVSASRDNIELKDVTAQTLYLRSEAGDRKVDLLDITQGLPDTGDYYALIQMKDLPDFYAGVREFHLDETNQKLYVVLDQDGLVTYGKDGARSNTYAFPIAYRDGDKDHALIESAKELFAQMAANPSGNFELTCDLDASDIGTAGYAVPGTFSGTLNGNGHTIYNLPVGLFQKLSKATVQNLVLEDARVTVAHSGILAGSIENQSVVEKVFLVDCSLRNSGNMVGGFAGKLANATVRRSGAANLTIQADNTIGGIAGQTDPGSKVEDCYVTGQLQGTRNNNMGARIGGISGWHNGASIERCVTKVNISAPKNTGNGGIIGGPNTATSSKISHCVSLGGGTAYRIAGFTAALSAADTVYEYAGSNSETNRTDDNSQSIFEVQTPDRAFYADTLGLDAGVWYLDLTDGGRVPSLQGDPLPTNETDYEIQENAQNIPSYQRVRAQADYRADREQAYANMARLMPYADTADWVAYGNALSADSPLLTRAIRYILPLNEAGGLVTGLEAQNPGAVQRIRVVYTDGTAQEAATAYHKTLGNLVAVYRLDGAALGGGELKYQFRGYVKDLSQVDLAGLVQTAAALDYDGDIAALTTETEGRLYRDYYQQTVQPELETVLRNLVLSQAQFPAYSGSGAVQSLVSQRLQDRDALLRTLYAYNYYDKWYHIDFAGVNLSDLLFFSGDLLNEELSARQLTDQLLSAALALRGTGKTYDFYTQILQPYTGKEMLDFLAEMAMGAGYEDPSDWFAADFDGILVEQAPDTLREGIEYRVWHAFQTLGGRRQIVLPIMTAPQEDMYILTVPSQLILGSMNRYNTYVNKDGGERARMEDMIRSYAQRYAHFYGTSANWITRAPEILNSFVNIQYDTRFNYPAGSVADQGEQKQGITQDPVIKWVYEAVGAYSDMGGVGAYANGTDVYCVAYPAIGTDFTFYALTHETAHNQDGRYFYAGYGRRSGTGAEAHADGNIAQQIEDGSMVFNISRVCDPASDVTNNLSYERIETADQVWDYYAKMFDTSYVIDYLAGQAFLQLEPEEQARVAIQATEETQGNSIRSIYTRLTADDFRAMKLENMADLWDNHIALKAPGTRASGFGAYGYESFYDINWYQPHYDAGMPDSSSFKRLAQEMLGIGGYEDGYVTYISGKSPNDLQALRTITGDPDITWREYKLDRYDDVAAKLDQIPYFDADQVIEQFKQAFRQDNDKRDQSIALQRTLYGVIKRATGDFVTGSVYEEQTPVRITTAEQLIQAVQENPMGYYLLENDLDFTGIPATDGAYIASRFIGALDGNGHRLLGVSQTLFKEMVYGQIMNLTVENPAYSAQAGAYLALSAKNSFISNVQVSGADLNLPLVKQKSGGYYELGTVEATIGQKTISTVEELLAIGTTDTGRKMDYVLANDLDFQGVALDGAAIPGTFAGKLDGAGHKILNLSAPLFETVDNAQIRNLTFEGASLTRDKDKGLLANTLSNSRVENLCIQGSKLTNNSNQIGMLAGLTRSSTLSSIALVDITVSANNTVGGVAGQMDGTTLENCVVTGSVQGVINNGLGSRAGGITGWLSGDSTLKNCYVRARIAGAKPQGDGGLIGGPNTGNAKLYDSVSLSTGPNAYRISGFPVLGIAENVYELESSDSLTNRNETNADRIKSVTEEEARNPAFYIDSLGWSEEIWDFSQVASGGFPMLRNVTMTLTEASATAELPSEQAATAETAAPAENIPESEAASDEQPAEQNPLIAAEPATAETAQQA